MEHNDKIISKIHDYCLSKTLVYESRPFGEYPICYRVMGKIFAQFTTEKKFYRITLKCKPDKADLYRQLFPGVVVRGYHCPPVQQPYWNTVDLDSFNDMDLLLQMIDEAFLAVVDSFSRKAKAELAALEKLEFQYNDKVSSDNIHDTIVVYKNNEAVACGGLTMYSEDRAELVDIYVEPEYENFGLEAEIVRRLEAKAKIKGYNWCVVKLNTGRDKVLREVSSSIESSELISTDKLAKDSFNETYNLYKRAGYRLMPDFGEYSEISDCLYLERKI